jgi:MerR family transcriptional regulator, light-induced transcriptional regulator
VLTTWESVLQPVLVAVGDRWAATGEGVEVEHLLSDCAVVALREVAEEAHEPLGGRPVLLASAPDELHSLPLHVLSAGLAERGIATRTLGPALPADALQAAVRRTGPALLFLWSQLPSTADPALLAGLPVMRPPTAVVVGGPGWEQAALPGHVNLAYDLAHALDLVEQALGG